MLKVNIYNTDQALLCFILLCNKYLFLVIDITLLSLWLLLLLLLLVCLVLEHCLESLLEADYLSRNKTINSIYKIYRKGVKYLYNINRDRNTKSRQLWCNRRRLDNSRKTLNIRSRNRSWLSRISRSINIRSNRSSWNIGISRGCRRNSGSSSSIGSNNHYNNNNIRRRIIKHNNNRDNNYNNHYKNNNNNNNLYQQNQN